MIIRLEHFHDNLSIVVILASGREFFLVNVLNLLTLNKNKIK